MFKRKNFNLKQFTKNEQGNSLIFFLLFVLPILSFLFAITFDVATLYTKRRHIQNTLDNAVLTGVKFYPYIETARAVTEKYLSDHELDGSVVTATRGGISVSYSKRYEFVFSKLIYNFSGKRGTIAYPVSAFSQVSPSISDVLILLDRNTYNSPNDEANTWGGDTAKYFEDNEPYNTSPKYFTEQCFNEVISPLKKLVIDTYYYYASTVLNSVGVGVYPGVSHNRSFDFVKEIKPLNHINSEGLFLEYFGDDDTTSKSCFEAYNYSLESNNEYQIEDINSSLGINERIDNLISDDKLTSVATSVWSLPVHKGSEVDFSEVLTISLKHLMAVNVREDRHSKSTDITKNLFVFTSKLPIDSNFQTTLNFLDNIAKEAKVKINIIFAVLKTDKVSKLDSYTLDQKNKNIKVIIFNGTKKTLDENLSKFQFLNKKEGSIWS